VEWIPSHCGIPGNEAADSVAKEATEDKEPKSLPLSLSYLKRKIREKLLLEWKEFYFEPSDKGTEYSGQPSLSLPKELRSRTRGLTSQIISFRTGHGYFKAYFDRFNISQNSYLCGCGCPQQTRTHLLKHCPLLKDDRPSIKTVTGAPPTTHDILHTKEGIIALTKFLSETGVGTRQWFTGRWPQASSDSESIGNIANYQVGLGDLEDERRGEG